LKKNLSSKAVSLILALLMLLNPSMFSRLPSGSASGSPSLLPPSLLWNDNFYASPLLNQWSVYVSGSGVMRNDSSQYYSSPYSFHMNSPGSSQAYAVAPMNNTIPPNSNGSLSQVDYSKNYKVELYFYLPSTSNHWIAVFLNRQIDTVIDTGTTFTARWGGNNYAIISLNTTTWYRITYNVTASASQYYVDIYNTKLGRNVVTHYTCNFDSSSQKTFLIGDFEAGSSNYGEAYWDNISIHFVSLPPLWYYKPSYPDYAPSGMPDFDERQNNWYWRAWSYPDAVAVWQHYNPSYNDWDIYYSIYTDANPSGTWWTLGKDYARPIVSDPSSGGSYPFLPGDDKQPAISWYSSNYAICVWQHQTGDSALGWDIWYSAFTPNLGWSPPASIAVEGLPGDDTHPAIAFDTNGWAVCTWVHTTSSAVSVIYYSVWDPRVPGVAPSWGQWRGPNALLNAGPWPGKAATPEVDVDSNHMVVTIWTDTPGAAGTERVYFSWTSLVAPLPPLPWSAPAIVPGCPAGMDGQKGISPDTLGNNLMDWGLPGPSAGQEPLFYANLVPGVGWNPIATLLTNNPLTNGGQPDLAYDFHNNAIAVYSQWPTGQIWYSFWNGLSWQPAGGQFAATSGFGPDQWPSVAFIKNNKAVLVWNAYPEPYGAGMRSEIYYSVYTPTYPADSWTPAKKIYAPNNPGIFLTGDDYYVDIASPTGSATTPMSVPPAPPPPPAADIYWTWCGPLAVANSIWWFDSKYEPNAIAPPTISDGFPLVRSYNQGVWDDHDPRNVKPFVEHLAWLMDTDGMRTGLCHDGTTVWDMQAGIAQYLSWSGANPLGDVDGNGIVDQSDVNIVQAAMGSRPGDANWNMSADIWPETVTGPKTADNVIDQNDLNLVKQNLGRRGLFYEHTSGLYPSFSYIEGEVEQCQDVILCLGFYQNGVRDGGHFVTVAGVNSIPLQLLISNPIRDDYEAGVTPGRSVDHPYPHDSTVHNNASLVSQDIYTMAYNVTGGYWTLQGYFTDPAWEARIEFAVITSPTGLKHDVGVTNVKPGKTIVGRYPPVQIACNVSAVVVNGGDFNESVTLSLSAFITSSPSSTLIGNATIPNLLVGETRNVTFVWNTTGWTKGNYTVWAYARPVPFETNIANNRLNATLTVIVAMAGDVQPPWGFVDMSDISYIARRYGMNPTNPMWDPNADITNDNFIDMGDIAIAARQYGLSDP
jgi:hypothetical protein